MQRYNNNAQDKLGNALAGATVTVRVQNVIPGTGALASLFSDTLGTLGISNPTFTDANGMFGFCVADGFYDITVTGVGVNTITLPNVRIEDYLTVTTSQIVFVASGTGAVKKNILSKLRNTIDLNDYAACDGVTDDTAQINLLKAALPAGGGTIRYAGTPLISSSITSNKCIRWLGDGGMGINSGTLPSSYFIKKSTMTTAAMILTSPGCIMEGGGIVAQGGNTGDNLVVTSNSATIYSFYSQGAGNDNFRHGTDITGGLNCNSVLFLMCRSYGAGRYGFFSRDFDSNNNNSTWLACGSQNSGSDGFRNGVAGSNSQGSNNKYINILSENNVGQGINIVGGTANCIDGGDIEVNTAGQILIGIDAVTTELKNISSAFTIVDNSSSTIRLDLLAQKQGLWTPVLAGDGTAGTQTYGTQAGTYQRLGSYVIGQFTIVLTVLDAATAGNMIITGLPFLFPSGFTGAKVGIDVAQWGGFTLTANYTQFGGRIDANSQVIKLLMSGSGQAAATITKAMASSTSTIVGSFIYPIAQF